VNGRRGQGCVSTAQRARREALFALSVAPWIHNWIKAKQSLTGINFAIRNYFNMLPMMPGGKEIAARLKESLSIPQEEFEYRWAAD
jgi:hypothetical protein